jgi:NADH-quinone oxidoreductase subunit F
MATWEAAVDPEALRAAGLGLGTASIFVLDASSCVVSVIHSIARFFARESCGQCPPCVLGSTNLLALLTGASGSDRRLTPDGAIAETASFMAMHGYCGHSPAAARIVPALFRRFRDHVGAHLAMVQVGVGGGDSCPEGLRMRDPFAPGSPELDRLERAALGSAEGAVA